jgi:hypothetical protein
MCYHIPYMTTMTITVYLYHENRYWIAQCAEHDILAQGGTSATALARFPEILNFELHHVPPHVKDDANPLSWIPQLPQELVPTIWKPLRTDQHVLCGVNFTINYRISE